MQSCHKCGGLVQSPRKEHTAAPDHPRKTVCQTCQATAAQDREDPTKRRAMQGYSSASQGSLFNGEQFSGQRSLF